MRSIAMLIAGLVAAGSIFNGSLAFAQGSYECGHLENAYGPFDYYVDKDKLPIVEVNHFTSGVEFFREQKTSAFGGDIDYTLRAFPNHPRALAAMIRLGERERTDRPRGAGYTVFCYLERAIRFRPDDGAARMIMATYLLKKNRTAEAIEHLKHAEAVAGSNGNLHYNLGLAYVDIKDYPQALYHAHLAKRYGFDLPGLRRKLEAVGHWREPLTVPDTDSPDSLSGPREAAKTLAD